MSNSIVFELKSVINKIKILLNIIDSPMSAQKETHTSLKTETMTANVAP